MDEKVSQYKKNQKDTMDAGVTISRATILSGYRKGMMDTILEGQNQAQDRFYSSRSGGRQ